MEDVLDRIFLAYDVRGKVGDELTPSLVSSIGKSFADFLGNAETVAVGYDMRPDSKELAEALIDGLTSRGCSVMNVGMITSDMIYFSVGNYQLAGGAMVTASHNPGEYNGIKFCGKEAKAIGIDSGLREIKQKCLDKNFNSVQRVGVVEEKDVMHDWLTHALSFIELDSLKPLKIAVDAGNGMAGLSFSKLESQLPFEVTEMYFEPDGSFPNHIANPLIKENLRDLQKELSSRQYDAGLAFDGDGDRAVLVDEKGEPISGTVMTSLLAKYFLGKQPAATILCNAICGQVAHDTIKAAGGKSIKTKVGHSYIKADMRKYSAVFAGEHSGHYYFQDNWCADSGLIAALIALYLLSLSDLPLNELVKPYREAYVQIEETNFTVENKVKVLDRVKAEFKDMPIDELDGLTVTLDDGWFNLRASNTEPLLRLNAEATSKDSLEKIVKRVTVLVRQ